MKTIITVQHATRSQLTSILSTIASQIAGGVYNASADLKLRRGYETSLMVPPAAPSCPGSDPMPGSPEEMVSVGYEFSIKE